MKKLRGYKILLWKAYLDKGMGVTNYAKYIIAFFGIASLNWKATMIIAVIYALICLIVGRAWFIHHLQDTETEISNQFNPFVREMRSKI